MEEYAKFPIQTYHFFPSKNPKTSNSLLQALKLNLRAITPTPSTPHTLEPNSTPSVRFRRRHNSSYRWKTQQRTTESANLKDFENQSAHKQPKIKTHRATKNRTPIRANHDQNKFRNTQKKIQKCTSNPIPIKIKETNNERLKPPKFHNYHRFSVSWPSPEKLPGRLEHAMFLWVRRNRKGLPRDYWIATESELWYFYYSEWSYTTRFYYITLQPCNLPYTCTAEPNGSPFHKAYVRSGKIRTGNRAWYCIPYLKALYMVMYHIAAPRSGFKINLHVVRFNRLPTVL